MDQLVRDCVMLCEKYLRESRINPGLTAPPLQNTNEYITVPEDALQTGLVPGLHQIGTSKQSLKSYLLF